MPETLSICSDMLILNEFLKSKQIPIGEIQDFFYRVEFQQRGYPHIHALFWVKDALQLGKNPNCDIRAFVDKYVTCKSDLQGVVDAELINCTDMQKHAEKKAAIFAGLTFQYFQCLQR